MSPENPSQSRIGASAHWQKCLKKGLTMVKPFTNNSRNSATAQQRNSATAQQRNSATAKP